MKEIFKRHPRYHAAPEKFETLPDDLWVRCPRCRELLYSKELEQALRVCSKCKYHFSMTARDRIASTVDDGSFTEYDPALHSVDPLQFSSLGEPYRVKLEQYADQAETNEALIYGTAKVADQDVVIGATEFKFCGGSMGAAFGEKVARAIDLARDRSVGLVLFSSGGGARMQEGTISLMQMAKTVAALDRFKDSGLPFISVLADNCLGGITASYAMLGDVNIAEPGAYIGFAGRRVIEQTMRQKLPQNAATSEFLLPRGMVDMVVARPDLSGILGRLLSMYVSHNSYPSRKRRIPQHA
ncbi:MAG: acetyl-CoA carboxylase, carboxyltransferase subunit beta [Chloroflexota bacterium]